MAETRRQEAVRTKVDEFIATVVNEAVELAAEAKAAVVKLPALNEDGESVIARDNNNLRNRADALVTMARDLVWKSGGDVNALDALLRDRNLS